mmetsp:Transcript_50000/g.143119  ORF Transcript_50000/g.143119 Transcript_50000/m.143119 type:complete len:261 (-) Transcript_50000:852-1634(-)
MRRTEPVTGREAGPALPRGVGSPPICRPAWASAAWTTAGRSVLTGALWWSRIAFRAVCMCLSCSQAWCNDERSLCFLAAVSSFIRASSRWLASMFVTSISLSRCFSAICFSRFVSTCWSRSSFRCVRRSRICSYTACSGDSVKSGKLCWEACSMRCCRPSTRRSSACRIWDCRWRECSLLSALRHSAPSISSCAHRCRCPSHRSLSAMAAAASAPICFRCLSSASRCTCSAAETPERLCGSPSRCPRDAADAAERLLAGA